MNPEENRNNLNKERKIIIPPEPSKPAQVPPEFGSPALFQKEEIMPEVSQEFSAQEEQNQKPLKKKMIIFIVSALLVILLGIISIIQISISNRFTSIVSDNTSQNQETEEVITQEPLDTNNPSEYSAGSVVDDNSLCNSTPFVSVVSPTQNDVFAIGDTLSVQIELCGISPSLFSEAMLEYIDPETNEVLGQMELSCILTPQTINQNQQEITWQIPPFFEIESPRTGCLLPVVNLLNNYQYRVLVEYARGTYTAQSEIFSIQSDGYVYTPPQFSEYAISPDTNFPRANSIDSSAPSFLQEVISPIYFQSPALFANYYRWYVIPRGPSYLIDLRDGKTYPSPATSGQVYTKPLSELYISQNPIPATSRPSTGQTHQIIWYIFNENTKDFITIAERMCNIQSGTIDPIYENCIPLID